MRTTKILVAAIVLLGLCMFKCTKEPYKLIHEGVIYRLEWARYGGQHGELYVHKSVPGGRSVNKYYGRLYLTHIVVKNNQDKDLGPLIIPFEKLISVQFANSDSVLEKNQK